MTRSRHPFSLASLSFIPVVSSLIVCTLGAQAASPVVRTDANRITAATNLTLRATPAPDALAIAQLPLGTELIDAGPAGLDKTWIRVRLADNREGWILSNLTRTLDPVWRWPTFDRIISERLGRKGDGFAASAELVAFIGRVAPEYTDPDGRGRVELSRIRAMAATVKAIPMSGGRREPYASWLASKKTEVVYDEPGGRWILAPVSLWDMHAQQARTTSADDIAWFAVGNGLPGECEGFVPCYLVARNRMQGEYLRRHPGGAHAGEAVGVLKSTADVLGAPPKAGAAYKFDKKTDCRDVTTAVDALTAAVQATRVEGRDAAIASLAALKRGCQ
jgi:hypothetical protein